MNIEEVREYCLSLPYVTEDEFFPGIITFRIEEWIRHSYEEVAKKLPKNVRNKYKID